MLSPSAPPTTQADQAAMCKSTNEIPNLYASLQTCTNATETNQMNSFIQLTSHPKADFDQLVASYNDMIMSGDAIFGTAPNTTALQQVQSRNQELKKHTENLGKSIKEKEAIVERTDRDFIDTKETMPGTLKTKTVHVLDDYTLIVLCVAYVFFILTMVIWYSQQNNYSAKAIGTSLVSAIILTALIYSLLINFL